MRIAVHFERGDDGLVRHETKIAESEFLAEEMDAVEYEYRDNDRFRWMPDRDTQIKLIKDAIPQMFVDPLHFSWPFRRAVIEQMSKGVERCHRKSRK